MSKLKDKRVEAGLTLKNLAEASGVHYMKIQQIEKGKIKASNMTLRNAVKLATALGCHAEDLYEETPEDLEDPIEE